MTLSADDRPGDEPGGIAVDPDLPPPAVDPEVLDEQRGRWTPLRIAVWVGVALLGGLAWVMIALVRGETVNAIWFVFAAVCTYFIAYRFYSTYIEKRITQPDDRRATPAEYNENGQDYMPMDRRVLYGHHFAAIAGAGPLVGPVLAAQWGYLPGTLWIIVGVILAGAVQDYLVLFFSMRRGGRSLGQMAREELGSSAGSPPCSPRCHHDHHRGDPRPGRGERARREPVGRLLGRDDHPDRPVHGRLPAVLAAGQDRRGLGHRLRPADGGDHRRRRGGRFRVGRRAVHPGPHDDRLGHHHLRLRGRGAARVAAAGPAGLPLHVHEDRHDPHARGGDRRRAAGHRGSGRERVRGPPSGRTGGVRAALPVPVRDDRLRRALRLPRADRVGHHAQAGGEGAPDAADRLRRHAHGVVRRDHGPGRRALDRPGHLLRHERLRGRDRRRRRLGCGVREPARPDRGEHLAGRARADRRGTSARSRSSPAPAAPRPWPSGWRTSCSSSSAAPG